MFKLYIKHGFVYKLIWRVFRAHLYSKWNCIAENIDQWNVKLSGVGFPCYIDRGFFTLRYCPYK